jgi:hypothetical protein
MIAMRRFSLVTLGAATALVSGTALAEGAGAFGQQGQISLQSDFELTLTHTSQSQPGEASTSTTTITLAPALDYFVIQHLSIGGQLLYSHESSDNLSASTFGIGPRVGYDIPLGDVVSLWIRAGIRYETTSGSEGNGLGSASFNTWTFVAGAPFLIHPAPHFFIGFGPVLSVDLSSSYSAGPVSGDGPKQTTYGIATTVGGWF